jgi:hypothetical protein
MIMDPMMFKWAHNYSNDTSFRNDRDPGLKARNCKAEIKPSLPIIALFLAKRLRVQHFNYWAKFVNLLSKQNGKMMSEQATNFLPVIPSLNQLWI